MSTSRIARKAKRQSFREFSNDVTAEHTLLARFGLADEVAGLLQRAYRIGLHKGKRLAGRSTKQGDSPPTP